MASSGQARSVEGAVRRLREELWAGIALEKFTSIIKLRDTIAKGQLITAERVKRRGNLPRDPNLHCIDKGWV